MSMLEPSLNDLAELKGRSSSLVIEVEEHKNNLQFLIEERKKCGSDGGVVKLIQELRALQQDFTMMRGNMASEMTVLEGTIPNAKEIEARTID
eukprot:2972875-Prorocentrum_lima.AAC.1